MDKKLALMFGSLLHDIGKIIYRCHNNEFSKGTHSALGWQYLTEFKEFQQSGIEESIRFHHYKELAHAGISEDSLAYITYIADNIASGADRRDSVAEGEEHYQNSQFSFNKSIPLSSIFNILNQDKFGKTTGSYTFGTNELTKYPSDSTKIYSSGDYAGLKTEMTQILNNNLKFSQQYFGSLLQWTESMWSYIPSSTNTAQLTDISLYDHSKVTCALASCIYDYLKEAGIHNFKGELFSPYEKTKQFYDKNVFLLFSMDMSGIQDFIYNISGAKALKSLRSRSFYLEIMLETIVDQLLDRLSLSRANLLYTGGGHAYVILPNTEFVKKNIAEFDQELRNWFLSEFTVDLSIALAYQPCSGNDLMNANGNYKTVWQSVSQKLSDKKARRYQATEILALNQCVSYGDRECKECLRSDLDLTEEGLCPVCEGLIHISNDLRDKEFFVVGNKGKVMLPIKHQLSVVSLTEAEQLLNSDESIKIYSKNRPYVGKSVTTNLWMCDYDQASRDTATKEAGIASYTNREKGIRRLGVLRADIDNLGATFINGIPDYYNSLSRTATLSRNLSMFFKYELNNILEGSAITVIYSGGDDLFLIGAWDEIIAKAIEIRASFEKFTMNKLSFSAGIGMFPAKYPISKMASETGSLEETAKSGQKNQVVLWIPEKTYSWSELSESVLTEKLSAVQEAFTNTPEHGKAFIYRMLELLRNREQINIARLAYTLARSNMKDSFSMKIFQWAQEDVDRNHLITALEYYIYETRED